MHQTNYHRPSSVDEAAALFAKGSDAKYLAGGHTLLPVMKQRLASPTDLIDLARIKELVGIEATGDTLLFRHPEQCGRQEGDTGAGLADRCARRSRGALSRHHRRLDREQ